MTIIATPPGKTIEEQLVMRHMTTSALAEKMSISINDVELLLEGRIEITLDIALELEFVLGIPAQFWLELEELYREKLELLKREDFAKSEIQTEKDQLLPLLQTDLSIGAKTMIVLRLLHVGAVSLNKAYEMMSEYKLWYAASYMKYDAEIASAEFTKMALDTGGELIHIKPGTADYFNPLDEIYKNENCKNCAHKCVRENEPIDGEMVVFCDVDDSYVTYLDEAEKTRCKFMRSKFRMEE